MISSIADIRALEAQPFETVFPIRSPWGLIQDSARRFPDNIAIRFVKDAGKPAADTVLSYRDFASNCMSAARVFRNLGVVPGKAVVLLTQHTPSAQTALWGAQIAGHACPINPMLKPDHIAALLVASNAAVVVMTGVNAEVGYWSALSQALRAQGVSLPILACDADADCPGADGIFEDLVAANLDGPDIEVAGDEHALAALYHTGGTTGAPKLVQHSRLNEAHVARSCAMMHDLSPGDVVVNGLPLFHVAGAFVCGLSVLSVGGTLLVPGQLGMRNAAFVSTIWQQVECHGVTIVTGVPTVLAALNAVAVDADLSTLRCFLTGGSPLPTELADSIERKTGKGVRNILGMTECGGTTSTEPVHAPRTPMSCGLPIPFCEVAALGETDGEADPDKVLQSGETGIVALRGPNVSAGYSDPKRNAGTFLPGGWLVSGDLGKIDAQGRLFVTGRKKDLIIRGAHNIDPQMIEDALLAHPDVVTAAAVGMPDAYAGELPVAFVTLRAGSAADGGALIAFLQDRIEDPVALPKRIGIYDALPVTPVGKIFKPELRRDTIRWAISDAAQMVGLAADGYAIEVGDTLEAKVTLPQTHLDALRDKLVGMPITVSFRTGATR